MKFIDLDSPVVISIIGASGGIGFALLEELAAKTDAVFLPTYNTSIPVDKKYEWIHYNSLDPISINNYFKQLESHKPAAIIDCSGAFFASSLARTTPPEIAHVISTNLTGPLIAAKKALSVLAPNGKIIFMSSILAEENVYGSSVYSASKVGLEKGIAVLGQEFLKRDLAICGIRLNYMDYGMTHKINTELKADILNSMPNQEFVKISSIVKVIKQILQGDSMDISGTIFALSEES